METARALVLVLLASVLVGCGTTSRHQNSAPSYAEMLDHVPSMDELEEVGTHALDLTGPRVNTTVDEWTRHGWVYINIDAASGEPRVVCNAETCWLNPEEPPNGTPHGITKDIVTPYAIYGIQVKERFVRVVSVRGLTARPHRLVLLRPWDIQFHTVGILPADE